MTAVVRLRGCGKDIECGYDENGSNVKMELERVSIKNGLYTARLDDKIASEIALHCNGEFCEIAKVTNPARGKPKLSVNLPEFTVDEGRMIFTLVAKDGSVLDVFSYGLENTDLQAEVDQIRAELDMVKSAFRREMRTLKKGAK